MTGTGKGQQYFLPDTRVSEGIKSLAHTAGLRPPLRYLTAEFLGKILKPLQKSSMEKSFSFTFLNFSENVTNHPTRQDAGDLERKRSLQHSTKNRDPGCPAPLGSEAVTWGTENAPAQHRLTKT